MSFDEFFEYFVIGGITVLMFALIGFIIWGAFFSSNEIINTITRVIGLIVSGAIVLVAIGIFVKEHVFG